MKELPEFSDIRVRWKDVKNINIGLNSRGLRTLFINGRQVKCSPKRNRMFGSGSRICYLGIDFIVKIDCPLNYLYNGLEPSWCQSDHEYQVWMSLDDEDRPYFAEVLSYQKHDYIVFKRYDIPIDICKISEGNKKLIENLESKYNLSDLGYNGIALRNVTEIDGKLLIFDYGLTEYDHDCSNTNTPAYLKFTQKKHRYY
jgi:hypothetical protein